ncbi:ATP-grasp domain-containing protein [Alteromonas sp. S167]|uniref:ATP-grasp domain-containing protein n=1 Tax=Alteromonas sp. S167 TaxID=3117402 RepID=UPI002FDFD1F8
MPNIALLSTDNLEDFFVYDELLIPYFSKQGWGVETVSWHCASENWSRFDYVIVRSTWDYQQHADEFLSCLKAIDASKATLLNPLRLMQWNIEKFYLKDLYNKGVNIVDTLWCDAFDSCEIENAFTHFATDTIVVKPVLSANADDTFKLSKQGWAAQLNTLARVFASRRFMIQPFLTSVVEEGEYSLFYFGGQLSHAIKKVPQRGDFRVQEEHGGSLFLVNADAAQQEIATQALNAMPLPALYARVDLIKHNNEWAIMELELIEPSLYFNLDDASPERFVNAMLAYHEAAQK